MMLLLQVDDIDNIDVYDIRCCNTFLVLVREFQHGSREK